MALEPITRQEQIIAGKDLKPITRMEMFLKEYGGASLISPSGKKFKLTVDDNGVLGTAVVKEETGGFPIAWNTMEVLGNPSCDISGMLYVKVSDFLPTADEITGTNFVMSAPGISNTSVTTTVESYGNVVVAEYRSDDMIMECYIAYEAGENDTLGVTFPESGCYFLDYGTLAEMSADCVIDLVK